MPAGFVGAAVIARAALCTGAGVIIMSAWGGVDIVNTGVGGRRHGGGFVVGRGGYFPGGK